MTTKTCNIHYLWCYIRYDPNLISAIIAMLDPANWQRCISKKNEKIVKRKTAHDNHCKSNFCFTVNWPLLFAFCMPDRWRHLSLLKRCILISPPRPSDLPHQKKQHNSEKFTKSTKKLCFCDSPACHAMCQNRYHHFSRNLI